MFKKDYAPISPEYGTSWNGEEIYRLLKDNMGIIGEEIIDGPSTLLIKVKESNFWPHIYMPQYIITSPDTTEGLPGIIFQEDYQLRSAIYFENQNKNDAMLNILTERQKSDEEEMENIRKIEKEIKDLETTIKALPNLQDWDKMTKKYQQELVANNKRLDQLKLGLAEKQNSLQGLTITLTAKLPTIEFKKINPIKYKIEIKNAKKPFPIVFSETFNKGWKVYPKDSGLNKFYETYFKEPISEGNHLTANGYANSWMIDPDSFKGAGTYIVNQDGSANFSFTIEFWPQRLFYLGLSISGVTMLLCLMYLVFNWRKKHSVKRTKQRKSKNLFL